MKTCTTCKRCFGDAESTCIDAAHSELSDSRNSIDIVPGYRIDRIAAESPLVSIYYARNLTYGQECFLSIGDGDTQKFLADAKIAAGLFHAGIAGVIESGELADSSAFAASEGFDGQALRELIADGHISLLDAIVITRQVAEAVQELHAVGLTHGAVTPDNVSIRSSDGGLSVKLHNIDYGSAFARSAMSNRFAMQSAIRTLRYLAPEQIRSEAASPFTDVYSLGVLLYELLSGHPPFDADSASAIVDMQLNQKPPEIAIENFDLRMLLTHTISEALQKQPSFRQSTADLFARQMRHIEQLATHVPTPPPAVHVKTTRTVAATPALVRSTPPPRPVVVEATHIMAPPAPEPIVAAPTSEVTSIPPGTAKRSRLKGMKKRLHTQTFRTIPTVPTKDPTLIGWQQPEDDIPSLEAVRDELEKQGASLPTMPDEEITAVRPPAKRIEIDLAKPSADTSAPEFLPTLLSTGRIKRRDNAVPTMFAGFQTARRYRKLPVYSAIVAVTALAGVSVLRIADRDAASTNGYLGGNDPVAVQTEPIRIDSRLTETKPDLSGSNEPSVTNIAPTIVTTNPPKPTRTDPAAAKQTKPAPAEPQPAAVRTQPKRADAIVPSTIVISTKGGRPTRTVLRDNEQAGAQKPSKPGAAMTRPRIVKDPE